MILWLSAWTTQVWAAGWETLVMPGEVIEGHADIERDCDRCHSPLSRGREPGLCLECHEAVAIDLRLHKGFHGRAPAVASSACRGCHSEHHGREADITGLARGAFDHRWTDFPLAKAHRGLACSACHPAGRAHRDAPASCFECHKEDDAHDGNLGRRCAACHRADAWGRANFDHSSTDFPLLDKHAKVVCDGCHSAHRYSGTPIRCASCHALDDTHAGRQGDDCDHCHTPRGWGHSQFDHDSDTAFRLVGAHRRTSCEACHEDRVVGSTKVRACVACHRQDDAHRDRFGERCEECHRPTRWKDDIFDHDRDTAFPLRGAHGNVACHTCHGGRTDGTKPRRTCGSCHRGRDVHAGALGDECGTCHVERGWRTQIVFDHDLTSFPLLGSHAVTACEECHTSATFQKADPACGSCHSDNDVHSGSLGPKCGACHNPNGWDRWRFDHDSDTRFPLEGAHADVACTECHGDGSSSRTDRACVACHAADDIHLGQYGRRCLRCHTTRSFRSPHPPQ